MNQAWNSACDTLEAEAALRDPGSGRDSGREPGQVLDPAPGRGGASVGPVAADRQQLRSDLDRFDALLAAHSMQATVVHDGMKTALQRRVPVLATQLEVTMDLLDFAQARTLCAATKAGLDA